MMFIRTVSYAEMQIFESTGVRNQFYGCLEMDIFHIIHMTGGK